MQDAKTNAEALRKLAAQLRAVGDEESSRNFTKAAHAIRAAVGIKRLTDKVRGWYVHVP